MVFKLFGNQALLHGRIDVNHHSGRSVIIDRHGGVFFHEDVEFVVPDDEVQAKRVTSLGFKTHTPMSVNLGPLGPR